MGRTGDASAQPLRFGHGIFEVNGWTLHAQDDGAKCAGPCQVVMGLLLPVLIYCVPPLAGTRAQDLPTHQSLKPVGDRKILQKKV